MNKSFVKAAATILFASLALTACNKSDSGPAPEEQELITTIRLTLTNAANSSDTHTYTYKIENGFNSSTPGTIVADTLKLQSGVAYNSSVTVLNEKATPVEDVTSEIISENLHHLFLYESTPATGAGSIAFSNGQKDSNQQPFNLTGTITAGSTGNGKLNLYLMHDPTDKTGTTPVASGGETDVAAEYPVRID